MNIDRDVTQPYGSAETRVRYCLDRLEKAKGFCGISMEYEVVPALTMEEIIGALVSAEQRLKEIDIRE